MASELAMYGLGLLGAGASAGVNYGITKRARQENYEYGELQAENADARTRALYNDLYSPQAQIKQLKEAGLSPSVYYDGGAAGMSGQSGAQGVSSSIQQAPIGFDPATFAQIANINADTRLKNTEADKNEGKNASGIAQIKLQLAQAGLAGAEQSLTEANAFIQQLEGKKLNDTYDAQVSKIFSESEEAAYNAKRAYFAAEEQELLYDLDVDTYDAQVSERINKANLLFWQAQVEEKKLDLTQEQIKNLQALTAKYGAEVQQRWKELQLQKTSIENQKNFWDSEVRVMFKRAQNEADKIYWDAVNEHRHETNRHYEEENRIELDEYRSVLQATCILGGLQARSGETPTPNGKSTNTTPTTQPKYKTTHTKTQKTYHWHMPESQRRIGANDWYY